MTQIIGFAGRKNSGKNTLADLVIEEYLRKNPSFLEQCAEKNTFIYSFAEPLKSICMNVLGLTQEQCYGSEKDKNTLSNILWESLPHYNKLKEPRPTGLMTAREVMQHIGTEIFRCMDENCWPKACIRKIEKDGVTLALICDIRFPNEVSAIQAAGGKVIKLTRKIDNSTHASESSLDADKYDWDNFDYVLNNSNETVEESWMKLKSKLEEWKIL